MKEITRQFQQIYTQILIDSCSNKRRIVRFCIVLSLIFLSWLVGYKWRDAKIFIQNVQISNLRQKRFELMHDVNNLESNLKEYNFMLVDGDWYRYLAFKEGDISIPKSVDPKHLKLLTEQAILNKIPLKYIYRLVWKESQFNPNALSKMGASGYMQIIPSSFSMFKARHSEDLTTMTKSEQNIMVGTYMLGYLYRKYKRWDLAFAAYNAGSIVSTCNCVPQISETQNYVKFIMN